MYSTAAESIATVVIMFNFGIIVIDTDQRASDGHSANWVSFSGDACFFFYVVEFAARFYVDRLNIFVESWNRLDFAVVLVGIIEKILAQTMQIDSSSMTMVRVFRAIRILRLMRALKAMKTFRELRKLVEMMLTCVRTLIWSCALSLMVMTMWGVLFVEFVGPLMKEMEEESAVWDGDAEWTMSYASVMRSNLSLFQTIVAGDSWGKVPVPVMLAHPWTMLLFLPAHVSLVFGVLNLVVAVVVDTFADVREQNLKAMSTEKAREEREEKAALAKIFDVIDANRDSLVSFEELEAGAAAVPEMRQRLRVMGVKRDDLVQLFRILDADGSGDVDPEEFIDAFYRMKCTDPRSSLAIVKSYVTDMMGRQEQVESTLRSIEQILRMEMRRAEPTTVSDGSAAATTLYDAGGKAVGPSSLLQARAAGHTCAIEHARSGVEFARDFSCRPYDITDEDPEASTTVPGPTMPEPRSSLVSTPRGTLWEPSPESTEIPLSCVKVAPPGNGTRTAPPKAANRKIPRKLPIAQEARTPPLVSGRRYHGNP